MAKKQSSIQIHDAKLTISRSHPQFSDGVKKSVPAFRVKSVGKNGEILQTSEVLESVKAVKVHIDAMFSMYGGWTGNYLSMNKLMPIDYTKDQKFFLKGYATSGLKK
jgi:hypothetical protein